jgi:hypothetical protein
MLRNIRLGDAQLLLKHRYADLAVRHQIKHLKPVGCARLCKIRACRSNISGSWRVFALPLITILNQVRASAIGSPRLH